VSKPLTDAAVAKLRPAKDRLEIPDGGCRGLYLVIQPNKHKSWALRFRRPDGRPAKLTLGTVHEKSAGAKEPDVTPTVGGHLTLAAAHELVGALRREIAQGRDPAAVHLKEKQERRVASATASANTFAAAAKDFVERHARPKVRRWQELARLLGLQPHDLSLIPKGLADRWAERPVVEIDGHDIHSVIDEARRLGVPGLERREDGPSESRARKLFSVLSKLFSWLVQQRRLTVNPCIGVHRPDTPKARERVLSNAEIAKFWRATDTAPAPFVALLKLLLLTGCRLNEVAGMRREELSDDRTQWLIPGNRTKNHRPHVVPLPAIARELIASAPRIEGSELVFTTTGRSPVSGWNKIKDRLDEAMNNPPHWVLHDLRRTCVTGMAELGIRGDVIELCVNHVSGTRGGIAGVYNRSELLPERKAALERWAAHIDGLISGRAGKVIALRG
jgi:integrase